MITEGLCQVTHAGALEKNWKEGFVLISSDSINLCTATIPTYYSMNTVFNKTGRTKSGQHRHETRSAYGVKSSDWLSDSQRRVSHRGYEGHIRQNTIHQLTN